VDVWPRSLPDAIDVLCMIGIAAVLGYSILRWSPIIKGDLLSASSISHASAYLLTSRLLRRRGLTRASSEDTHKAPIGPFEAKTTVRFYVEAYDKAENKVISDTHSFTVKATPTPYPYASGIIVVLVLTIAFAPIRHWMKNRVK